MECTTSVKVKNLHFAVFLLSFISVCDFNRILKGTIQKSCIGFLLVLFNNYLRLLFVAVSFEKKKQCAWLIGVMLISTPVFSAEQLHHYNISEQSLNDALLQFAADSKLELIFATDRVRGIKVNTLIGKMTAKQVLEILLKGSGNSYRFIDSHTVTIIPNTDLSSSELEQKSLSGLSHSDAIRFLNPMTIVGKEAGYKEGRYSRSKTYKAQLTSSSTRTETLIKATPQSIQVITDAVIDDQGSLTVSETLRNISGVSTGHSLLTPSFEFTHIRGFAAEQLLDGFTQYYNPGDKESLINIERIDVLKGSNALLYGGGSGSPAGGLVNIITKQPKAQPFGEAGIKYGAYQFYQPYFDFNQPINKHILFRVTGEYTYSESYVDVIETERYNVNPSLILTDNESTKLIIQSKISKWEQVDYQGLPAEGTVIGSFSIQPDTFIGPKDIEPSYAEFYGIWGTLEHQVNDKVSVNFKARYTQSEFDQKTQLIFGSDGMRADHPLFAPATWALFNAELYQQQQEISFVGNVLTKFNLGPSENKLLLGADFSQFDDQGFIETDSIPIGFVDLRHPKFSQSYHEPGRGKNNVFITNITYGGYVQLQSTLYDRLHLLFGVRLGNVTIDYKNRDPGFLANARTERLKFLPRVGAVFDLTNEFSWFVSYSEGMRGQPLVNFVGTPEAELSQHIEAGIKFDFVAGLSGQVAVYQIDRSHLAIRDNTDLLRRSVSTGKQSSQGLEVDLVWQPNNEISLLSSYAYTDARYIKHQPVTRNGKAIPNIPNHSGRFWANYRFPQSQLKGLSIGAGVYAQSGVHLETVGLHQAESFYSVDAAINYETQHFKVSASIKNLTNEHYFESFNYFGGRFAPAQPISAYIDFSLRY
jgi:iron complex outermembrane receptor protein